MFDVIEFLAQAHKARRFSEGSLERAIIAAGVKAGSVDAAHKRAMRAAVQAGWWTRDGRTYHRPLEQEMPRAAVVLLKNMREGGKVRREQLERALELAGVPDPAEERIHVVSRMTREGWTTKDGVTFHAPRPPKPAKAERPAPPPGLFTDDVLTRQGERAKFSVVRDSTAPQGRLV